MRTLIGAAVAAGLGGFEAFILWRYPELRRALREHYKPSAIAKRLEAHADKLEAQQLGYGIRPDTGKPVQSAEEARELFCDAWLKP